MLEARIAPASVVSLSGSNLSVVDSVSGNDNITVTIVGLNHQFTDPSGITAGAGAVQINANTVSVPTANFSTLSILTNGGTDTVTFASALNLAALTADAETIGALPALTIGSGGLDLTTSGPITQSAALTVTGTTTLASGATNDITLNDVANDFSTVSITTGRNVTLADVNGLDIGASTVSGTLGVTAAGVTVTGAIAAGGDTTFSSSEGITFNNSLTLAAGKNFAATATGATTGTINFANSSADLSTSGIGSISLTAQQTVSLASGSSITTANGDLTVVADKMGIGGSVGVGSGNVATLRPKTNGVNINLGSAVDTTASTLELSDTELDFITAGTLQIGDSNSGAITVSAAITHANTLSLTTGSGLSGSGGLTLAASKNFTVTANGAITQGAVISVPGTTTLAAGAGNNITLNSSNDFSTLTITSASAVSVTDSNALILGTSTIAGTLSLTTGGAITQSGGSTVAAGTVTINAGGAVTLTNSNAVANLGAVSSTSFALSNTTNLVVNGVVATTAGGVAIDVGTNTLTTSAAITASAGSSVAITADNVAIGASVTGPGGITIQPSTLSRAIYLNNTGTGLSLDSTELGLLSAASNTVTIGASGGTGAISIGGAGALGLGGTNYNLSLRGGATTFTNGLTLGASKTVTFETGAITGSGATDVTSSGGTLIFNTTGAVTMKTAVANLGASTASTGVVSVSNTGSLTVSGAISFTGNLTLATDTTLTIGANLSKTSGGGASATLSANNGITFQSTRTLASTSGALNVTLNSDADANQQGSIFIDTTAGITSNGGDIILGGGLDPSTTAAFGSAAVSEYGVRILGSISAGAGNVIIHGQSRAAATGIAHGVDISTGSGITTTTGNITIVGTGGNSTLAASGVNITKAVNSTSGGNISITGMSTGSAAGSRGLFISATTVSTTGAGTITLTGAASTSVANSGVELNTSGNVTSTGTGAISIDATAAGSGSAFVTSAGSNRIGFNGVSTYSGAITISADTVALAAHNINTTSTVTIQPKTLSATMSLNGGATLDLSTSELNGITGASTVVVGAVGSTGAIDVGSAGQVAISGTTYSLTLRGGNVTFSGATSPILALSSSKTFTLNTTGATGPGGAVADISSTAGTLVLNTTGLVNLRTSVGSLGASTLSGGSVSVNNIAGSLTVTGAVSTTHALSLSTTAANTDLTVSGGSITSTSGADIAINAARTITISQNVTTNGVGAITFSGNSGAGARNISIDAAGAVSTVNGALTIDADQGAGVSGVFSGVSIAGSVSVTGSGNLSVAGRGGNTSGSNAGVIVQSGGDIIGGTSGTMTITGFGGTNSGSATANYGVRVTGSGSTLISSGANVQVTGTGGGASTSSGNHGVSVNDGGLISASGVGTVTVQGTGGGGSGGANTGVFLGTNSATITSNGGAVTVIGIAGTGTSTAVDLNDATATITTATNGGNTTLVGDSMSIAGTVSVNGASTVTLRQNTNGNTIDLGAADSTGVLGLTDAELDQVTGGMIAIGNNNTGSITIGSAVPAFTQGSKNFTFTTGGSIAVGANSFATTGSVTLTADSDANGSGAISTGAGVVGAGTLTVTAATGIALNTAATTLSAINSTSGNITITEADGVSVTALATLAGNGAITFASTNGSIATSGSVTAHGSGSVSISAGGTGSLSLGAAIGSTTGTITLSANNGSLTTSGAVTTGGAGAISLSAGGSGNTLTVGAGVTTGSGSVALTADVMALSGVAGSISSSGALSIRPATASASIGLGTGAGGTLSLTGTELATFANGFSTITFGASAGSHAITIDNNGTLTFNDPVIIRTGTAGGSIALSSDTPLVGAGDASLTLTSAGIVTLDNTLTTSSQNIAVNFGQAGGAVDITVGLLNSGSGTATVSGGAGANTVTLTSTANPLNIVGGGGSDTLVAPNTVNSWNLSGGTLNSNVVYSGISVLQGGSSADTFTINANRTLNLKGGGGNDSFVFSDAIVLTGSINGEAGTDALDLSAYTTAVGVSLTGAGSIDGVAGSTSPAVVSTGFDNVDSLTGSGTFTGADATSTWAVGAAVTYTTGSSTVTLTGYTALQGGSGVDTFNVTNGHGISALRGGAGADIVNLNYSSGSPIPGGGLTIDGEGNSDSLTLSGTTATTIAHSFTNGTDGLVNVDGDSASYAGVETLTDSLGAANRVFNFNGGAETVSLSDAAGLNMTIGSTVSAALTFGNPTTSITINAGSGDDTINVTSMDSAFHQALTINGGAASDVVTLQAGLPTLASLAIDSDTVSALPALTIGAGGLSVTTTGGSITQTGALNVMGATTLSSGPDAITLTHAGNNFAGAVTATATGASAIALNDSSGGITIAAINAILATDVSVTAAGGGDITVSGSISAGSAAVTLTAAGDVLLGGGIFVDTLNLTAGGTIDQTAGSVSTTGVLTTVSAGGQTLTSTTNAIAAFIATNTTSGAEITLENGFDGMQIGPITNAAGPVTIHNTNGGLSDDATIVGTIASGGSAVGDIDLATSGTLTVQSVINSGSGSGGALAFHGAVDLQTSPTLGAGDITLTGGAGDLRIAAALTFARSFTLTTENNIVIEATVSATGSTSDLTILADSDADGEGGIYVKEDGFVSAGRDLTLSGALLTPGLGFTEIDEAIRIDSEGDSVTRVVQVQAVRNITMNVSTLTPNNVIAVAGYIANTNTGTTIGNIEFAGNVEIIQDTATVAAGGTGSILFDAGLDSAGHYDLRLSSPLGNVNFIGAVGVDGPLGDVSVLTARNVTAFSTFASQSVTVAAALDTVTFVDAVTTTAGTGTDSVNIYAPVIVVHSMTTGAGDVTWEVNSLEIAGAVTGTGDLTIRPITATRTIGINGVGDLNLDSAEIGNLQSGFSSITIGRTNGSGTINVGGASFHDSLTLLTPTGTMNIDGKLATTDVGSSVFLKAKTLNLNVDSATDSVISTEAGAITISNANVLVLKDTKISSNHLGVSGGDVTITATINGAHGFEVDALDDVSGGTVTFNGMPTLHAGWASIGGSVRPTSFEVSGNDLSLTPHTYTAGPQLYNAAGTITTHGGDLRTYGAGSVTLNGHLLPTENLYIDATDVTFGGAVDNAVSGGTGSISIFPRGAVHFVGDVGASTPLSALSISPATSVVMDGQLKTTGSIVITAGEIDFGGGPGSVSGNTISLAGTSDAQLLSIGAAPGTMPLATLELSSDDIEALGNTFSRITIGRASALGTLSIDGAVVFNSPTTLRVALTNAATIDFNETVTATGSASLTFLGSVMDLGANVTSAAGSISFTTTRQPVKVLVSQPVTVSSTSGNVLFNSTTVLDAALTVGNVSGNITFASTVRLGDNLVVNNDSGDVFFKGAVISAAAKDLSVTTSSGDVTFSTRIGDGTLANRPDRILVNSGGVTTLASVDANSVATDSVGTTTLKGSVTSWDSLGAQFYDPVTVAAAITVQSKSTGAVDFWSTVDSTPVARSLTLKSVSENITLHDDIGSTNPLLGFTASSISGDVTVDGTVVGASVLLKGDAIETNALINTTGNQSYTGISGVSLDALLAGGKLTVVSAHDITNSAAWVITGSASLTSTSTSSSEGITVTGTNNFGSVALTGHFATVETSGDLKISGGKVSRVSSLGGLTTLTSTGGSITQTGAFETWQLKATALTGGVTFGLGNLRVTELGDITAANDVLIVRGAPANLHLKGDVTSLTGQIVIVADYGTSTANLDNDGGSLDAATRFLIYAYDQSLSGSLLSGLSAATRLPIGLRYSTSLTNPANPDNIPVGDGNLFLFAHV